MTARACLIPGTKLAFVLVEGCRATEVMRTAYHARHGVWLRRPAEARRAIGEVGTYPFLIDLDGPEMIIALWRHPVARFAAFRQRVEGPDATRYHAQHDLPGASWERLLDFARWELGKADPATMDDSVRPQAASWRPDQVDVVMRAEYLGRRLRREGVATDALGLLLSPPRPLPRVPRGVAAAVVELYPADMELAKAVSR